MFSLVNGQCTLIKVYNPFPGGSLIFSEKLVFLKVSKVSTPQSDEADFISLSSEAQSDLVLHNEVIK